MATTMTDRVDGNDARANGLRGLIGLIRLVRGAADAQNIDFIRDIIDGLNPEKLPEVFAQVRLVIEAYNAVDLADEKGELCGRLFAEWGADVVRVEPPEGARSRRLPPFAPDGRTSLYFAVRNAGKRGIALDLGSDAGRDRLHELLAEADIAIESHAPGLGHP